MVLIQGKAHWCRIVGSPHNNKFNPDVPQWSFDLSVDDKTATTLLDLGMRKRYLKNKSDERGTFLSFVRESKRKDGTAGKPFKIVDAHNNPWPEDKLIGNGSTLNVIVTLSERSWAGEKFLKPSAISVQVWDLVDYEGKSEFPDKPDVLLEDAVDTDGEKETW